MFFPQLDSLRAIAVGCVLVHHWASRIEYGIDLGRFGVFLFFVLSGFLITGILLDSKALQIRFTHLLKQFYLRRVVRILPLFYFVVIIAALLNLTGARNGFWWHFFYLSNYRLFQDNHVWGPTDHFWSLAVEEQFYLFWPFFMLLFDKKWVPHAVLGLAILSNTYRVLHAGMTMHDYATPAVLDSLGLGALLAHILRSYPALWNNPTFPRALAVIGVACLATFSSPLYSSACTFLAACLVVLGARGFKGKLGSVMNSRQLRYLGRISYGIYVYHALTPVILHDFIGIPELNLVFRFTLWAAVTILVSALSWKYFERPINDLKRFFPYRDEPNTPNISILPPQVAQKN